MSFITGTTAGKHWIIPGTFLSDNFEISYGLGTLCIEPAPATINVTADDKVYDGTIEAVVHLSGIGVDGGELDISHTSASFADKDVAEDKLVTVHGIAIEGPDASNYRLNPVVYPSAEISARSIDVAAVTDHKDYDGSTSSGNWLYCNSYTEKGNMAARRGKKDPTGMGLYPEWSWCWPVNRRIIYNRASVDLNGKPWSPDKNILEYKNGKWVGDVPDGGWPPMTNKEKTKRPFIMKPDGVASVFGPGRADGPFPEHYEPLECPVPKNLFSSHRMSPTAVVYGADTDAHATCDPRFPFVGTTYRVTEHWQTGILTRWQPWLLETQPQLFVEMSIELGKLKGINNGDKCKVSSARGEVEAVAMVTGRFKPFKIQGTTVHQVGLPWCFGWIYPEDGGDSANLLTPSAGDPNTRIPETKAFMVNVEKSGKRRA